MALSSHFSQECVCLVFEAVNENSIYKLRLAKSTYIEIELLTSLTQCNEKGETPLVVAMQGKNVPVISQLVTMIKEFDRQVHRSQLMFLIDQLSNQIPVLELIENLVGDSYNNNADWLEFIAQVFINSTSSTRQDKIIALELIGAFLILEFPHPNFKAFFLVCWREAMILHHFPADGESILPKTPDTCALSVKTSVILGSNVEVMSMDEFELLQEDFQRSFFVLDLDVHLCIKRMKIQAVLVIRRICSQTNHGHPHWLFLKSLDWFGFYLIVYIRKFNQGFNVDGKIVMNICLLILEQVTGFDPKLRSPKSLNVFKSSMWSILTCFNAILKKPLDSPEREELSYANLLAPIRFITTMQCNTFNDRVYFANLTYRFLVLLDSISPQMTNQEKQKLEEYYSTYIRNFPAGTVNVLHMAVLPENISYSSDTKSLNTMKLILKLGADPNSIDDFGQTPLHILALIKKLHVNECLHVFQILLDAGGHLDIVDNFGETVLTNLKKTLIPYKNRSIPIHPYFESLLNTVFPLSCYCARVIRQHGLPFKKDWLPFHLQEFLAQHGIKCMNRK